METSNFVVLICLVLGVRSQTCDLIGGFKCLSTIAGFLESVSLTNNTDAETTVDTLCKTLDDLYVCIRDKMINCFPRYRLIYETALSSGRFICNAGRKEFIENFHCILSEGTMNNTMSCVEKRIDIKREIFANPRDTSQLLSRSAELCLKGSYVITCLIDSTNNDCGQTASTFLSEYMAVSLKALTSFLSCPDELGGTTEPQTNYNMSLPGINTPPSSVIYPEATPPNEHNYSSHTPSTVTKTSHNIVYPEPSARPGRKNTRSSTYPQPNPSSQPSYPEPIPSAEASHPEPTPSAEPSYPEPTPSAEPSHPEPTSSAELSYAKQMKTTTSGLYPELTPSPESSYLETTPSSKRATTTGVDYNKLTTPKMICKENEFKCRSNSCIPKAWICDGEKDCPGGEDEEECKSHKCLPGSWQCDNGICIKYRYKCNGIRDCKYGEDEKGCTWLTTTLRPKSSTTKRTTRQPTTTLAPSTKKGTQ